MGAYWTYYLDYVIIVGMANNNNSYIKSYINENILNIELLNILHIRSVLDKINSC